MHVDLRGKMERYWQKLFPEGVSAERLCALSKDYWESNCHKPNIPRAAFGTHLREVLTVHQQKGTQCLSENLLNIFVKHFQLSVEARASALTHSRLLPEWCSENPEDVVFGSLGSFLDTQLTGKNSLFLYLQTSVLLEKKGFGKQLQKIKQLVSSKLPTRIFMIANTDLIGSLSDREFLPIAFIPQNFPFSTDLGQTRASFAVSIMLVINKESMWTDPIDWVDFKEELQEWARNHCPNLIINPVTDSRFCERLSPSHPPRARALGKRSDPTIYQFFSLTPPHHENLREMVMKGVPVHTANLIYKISKHNPLLSILGVLPNQLLYILKQQTPKFDEAFDDIAFTLFFHGYQIWKLRKTLMSKYWKEIAREEWKPYPVKRKKKTSIIMEQEKCRSPFHFLERYRTLSKQRPTPCPCSHEVAANSSTSRVQDIRVFLQKNVTTQNSTISAQKLVFSSHKGLYFTREDCVRGEHDREKQES